MEGNKYKNGKDQNTRSSDWNLLSVEIEYKM